MSDVVVVGAGLAGLGAAYRLRREGVPCTIYEKLSHPGGHAASHPDSSGFLFDEGPHISFTKEERIRELFARSVEGAYRERRARVNNYWRGYWVKHPVQCNLHGLPADLVVSVIRDFLGAQGRTADRVDTYADWLRTAYGDTFAETFPMVYGLKYHTTPAANMTVDWLGPRLYRPDLEEVIRGAIVPETPEVHYITDYRYPERGGFVSFLNGLLDGTDVRLGREVARVDPGSRRLEFRDGTSVSYGHLISSVPLPELVRMVVGAPDDVVEAASRLACSSCVLVNLGVNRADLSEADWSYFYDEEIPFARISFPHKFSPHNAPPECGSIQAEIYFSEKYRPLDVEPDNLVEPVIGHLTRCGVLREEDTILFREARYVRYANVIFDHDRPAALRKIRPFLADKGIESVGRYGKWGYLWTDQSFVSGERAAERVIETLSGAAGSAEAPASPRARVS